MLLFLFVLLAALAFEYINGFHDAANAIATVVSTKVLTPRQAIALAAFFNLFGAFLGTAVAKTIGSGQVDVRFVTMSTVLAALLGAIVWNLITWYFGIPSSSSHALIGGLCGAALATSHGDWSVLIWEKAGKGLWPQIIVPMLVSPVAGLVIGFALMAFLTAMLVKVRPRVVNTVFGRLQIVSAAWMGLSHGTNDAQKTMGIIALALFTGTSKGAFDHLPGWLGFLYTPTFEIHRWVVVACALIMAAGTAAGGWRIIATMGHKMVRLQPVHGFAAETTAGAVIQVASHFGIPLSTTHVISTSIMGVGAMKRFSAVKWGLVQRIVWAWVLTLPVTGCLGYLIARAFLLAGLGQ
ncbi:MAG: inorganic phosphate transporter, PiT family [Chthoniobacter sp.]|jgi:PiT family inorganic phosphate transporter|nr:inorganic phosphate transporter, PiT family [Chthoniobacter sp.]